MTAKVFKGKPRINLPKVLKNDFNKYYTVNMATREHNYCHRLKLNNIQNLEEITKVGEVATYVDKEYESWRSSDIYRCSSNHASQLPLGLACDHLNCMYQHFQICCKQHLRFNYDHVSSSHLNFWAVFQLGDGWWNNIFIVFTYIH